MLSSRPPFIHIMHPKKAGGLGSGPLCHELTLGDRIPPGLLSLVDVDWVHRVVSGVPNAVGQAWLILESTKFTRL